MSVKIEAAQLDFFDLDVEEETLTQDIRPYFYCADLPGSLDFDREVELVQAVMAGLYHGARPVVRERAAIGG